MDVAYDSIQKEALVPEESKDAVEPTAVEENKPAGLNAEVQEALKAASASPWGAALGGFLGQVRKQGESLYAEAQKEVASASEQASKGLEGLRSNIAQRARGISIQQPSSDDSAASLTDPNIVVPASPTKSKATAGDGPAVAQRAESLGADIVKEATSLVSAFRLQASNRLKDLQRAEDAADEALLKFGSNIRDFFRDAVTITAPDENAGTRREVLFETNDSEGRRVFHTSRFEAQLHVIHMTPSSFQYDPLSSEWESWRESFNADNETERIAADLSKFDELRRINEKLVPQQVDHKAFWRRYYFLRKAVEAEEERRRQVLKGAAAEDNEQVGWDDDEEDESESSTPVQVGKSATASQSTTTLSPPKPDEGKEKAPRRSNEDDKKSTADSDASYDIVSGATSKTPGSPKEAKKDDSDDEDWE